MKTRITHERLLELVRYDQDSGVFTWIAKREHCRPGAAVGYLMPVGYISICLDARKYYGHRLAWFYVHGVWPSGQIDHINHDKSDNRIANLRDVSALINMQNRVGPGTRSSTGILGASKAKGGGFRATIKVNRRFVHIGVFPTAEEAGEAYMKYKSSHHPGYVRG